MTFSPRGRKGGGVVEWYVQRLSGGVLLLAVVFHFVYMHTIKTTNPRDLNFDSVAERLGNPEWVIFNLLLVTFSLLHAVIGLKISLDDFIKNRLARLGALSAVYVFMAALWAYGAFAIVKVGVNARQSHAAAPAAEDGLDDYNAQQEPLSDDTGPQAGDPPPQESPEWYPQEGGEK